MEISLSLAYRSPERTFRMLSQAPIDYFLFSAESHPGMINLKPYNDSQGAQAQ